MTGRRPADAFRVEGTLSEDGTRVTCVCAAVVHKPDYCDPAQDDLTGEYHACCPACGSVVVWKDRPW